MNIAITPKNNSRSLSNPRLWGSRSRIRRLLKKSFPKGDARSKMGLSLMERSKAFKDDLLDDDVSSCDF